MSPLLSMDLLLTGRATVLVSLKAHGGLLQVELRFGVPSVLELSTRIKDAGIAIRHLRGRILFYTAGSRNGLERVGGKSTRLKKKLKFQAVMKSDASAACPKTKIQESRGA